MMAKNCPQCGKQNSPDAWNCSTCGATLSVNTLTEIESGEKSSSTKNKASPALEKDIEDLQVKPSSKKKIEFSLDDRSPSERFASGLPAFILSSALIIFSLIVLIKNFSFGNLLLAIIPVAIGLTIFSMAYENAYSNRVILINDNGISIKGFRLNAHEITWSQISEIQVGVPSPSQIEHIFITTTDLPYPIKIPARNVSKFDELASTLTKHFVKYKSSVAKRESPKSSRRKSRTDDDLLQQESISNRTEKASAFYIFTVNPGYQTVIKDLFVVIGGWSINTLLFENANQPAESAEGTTNITISSLDSLEGNWALILPTDVLPYLKHSTAWSMCKIVKHLDNPMTELDEVTYFMAEKT